MKCSINIYQILLKLLFQEKCGFVCITVLNRSSKNSDSYVVNSTKANVVIQFRNLFHVVFLIWSASSIGNISNPPENYFIIFAYLKKVSAQEK